MDRGTKIGLAFGLACAAGGTVLSALPVMIPEVAPWIVWIGLPILGASLIYTGWLVFTWQRRGRSTSEASITVASHNQSGGVTAHTVRQGLDNE
jgi:divalent metal cation (Fe/Co/Zn/Cd) transporter